MLCNDRTKIIMVIIYFIICGEVWSTQTKSSQYDCGKHTGFPIHPL